MFIHYEYLWVLCSLWVCHGLQLILVRFGAGDLWKPTKKMWISWDGSHLACILICRLRHHLSIWHVFANKYCSTNALDSCVMCAGLMHFALSTFYRTCIPILNKSQQLTRNLKLKSWQMSLTIHFEIYGQDWTLLQWVFQNEAQKQLGSMLQNQHLM